MNTDRWPQIEAALDELLELPAERRRPRLAEIAAGDPELGRELEPFLVQDGESAGPLDDSLETYAAAVFEDATIGVGEPGAEGPEPGSQIGPYRVLSEIGHGGMGSVLLAERTDGEFEHQVALKVVRGGRRDIAERFRHERQILARLRHPNIATLFDGGTTGGGDPYFAMELVEGERITDYSDQNQLGIEDRIRLFEDVCRAVQHAHRNLVVHRDLKPGNVLVTREGTVKLLDFGIAKIVESEDDVSGTTRQFLTPAYAAPEQVLGEPTSTATDIYSLGVLLYELLTGRNPHGETSRSVEMARNVVENDPPSASSAVGPELARARGSDLHALKRRLRGDLDNILLKALQKAPEDRYASAEDLRADLERHRKQLPVSARPATVRYRVAKFARRHRVGAAAIVAVLLTAVVGFAGVVWQANVASRERDVARAEAERAEAVTEYLLDVFGSADPGADSGATLTAVELAERGAERLGDQFLDRPEIRASITKTLGSVFLRLAELEKADSLLHDSLGQYRTIGDHEQVVMTMVAIGDAYQMERRIEEAEKVLGEASDYAEAHFPPDHRVYTELYLGLGLVRGWKGDYEESEEILKRGLEMTRLLDPTNERKAADYLVNLGTVLVTNGKTEQSEVALSEALEIYRELEPGGGLRSAMVLSSLADIHRRIDRTEKAVEMARESLAMQREEYGEEGHPNLAIAITNLASALRRLGELEETEALQREAIEMFVRHLGPDHGYTGRAHNNLGITLKEKGDLEGAEREYATCVRIVKESFGERHPSIVPNLSNHADALIELGRLEEAEDILREAISISEEADADPFYRTYAMLGLARVCGETDRWDQCEQLTVEAWELRKEAVGEGHSAELEARILTAGVFSERGRPEEARPLLDSAIGSARTGGAPTRSALARALRERADLARDTAEPPEELAGFLRELLTLERERTDPDEEKIVALEREIGELTGT